MSALSARSSPAASMALRSCSQKVVAARRRHLVTSSARASSSSSSPSSSSSSSSSSTSSSSFSSPSDSSYSSPSSLSESSTSLPHSNHTRSFPPPTFPTTFGSNQVLPVPPTSQQRLSRIISSFHSPIRFAFAYGSGVFSQTAAGPEHTKKPVTKDGETGEEKKMVDLVLAVAHPEHWHGLNRQQFPKHYSWLSRVTGAEVLTGWVQRAGAGLWYHPYVRIDSDLIKYGVIDVETLCADLLDWDTLYVSGRMHKPVAMLIADPRVRLAQQVNLSSALRVALLLLPETFTEVELYTRIASLSYTGDFRMSVPGGENANKVRNIVLSQRSEFRRLYSGLLQSLGTVSVHEHRPDRFAMRQDLSPSTRAGYAARLPLRLRERLVDYYAARPELDEAFAAVSLSKGEPSIKRRPSRGEMAGDPSAVKSNSGEKEKGEGDKVKEDARRMSAFWLAAVQREDFHDVLLQQIAATVKGPAWTQSLKGVYTAGVGRTLKYVAAKVGKWFEGRRSGGENGKEEKDGEDEKK